MPGWWFTVESTTTKHLLRQFKSAIRAALASKQTIRAKMRARSAIQRFPVAHWKEQLANMHEISIKVNQKAALKHGLELRGEYNTSLASSALPSSATSAVNSSAQSSILQNEPIKEDDEPTDPPQTETSLHPLDSARGSEDRNFSLGVRTGPGYGSPAKSPLRRVTRRSKHNSRSVGNTNSLTFTRDFANKHQSLVSQDQVSSNTTSRTSSPARKQGRKRESFVRNSVTKAFARFQFHSSVVIDRSETRFTGDSMDEKAGIDTRSKQQNDHDEVLITPEQARASKKMSVIASGHATSSIRKSSDAIPFQEHVIRKASVQQQPSDAYLALIGLSRHDQHSDRTGSSSDTPSIVTSPHPSNPQTPVTPNFPESSAVHDFAATASPGKAYPTETFETRRATITFGSPGNVITSKHPVVDSSRFSYGTVLQGKKDYALQNVEPFFTDPTGLYYKAFHLELKDLNSKNSEDALCIEDFLTMSEKDWYNRLHEVKMGKRASRARPATIFHAPVRRAGSVISIFNENVQNAAVPDNSAEQYLLREQYQPPKGLKKLLLRRARQWPLYSFLLAFVSSRIKRLLPGPPLCAQDPWPVLMLLQGSNYCRKFVSGNSHQWPNRSVSE